MASRQQRCIPHVRDVFQLSSNTGRRGSRPLVPAPVLYGVDDCSNNNYGVNQVKVQHRTDQQYGNYGRTLTEQDVKHIERHLSMKKTIRKQLSRHLTQSYLDSEKSDVDADSRIGSGSESNFLDLLKDVRTTKTQNDSDVDGDVEMQSQWQRNFGKQIGPKKNAAEISIQETKKSSFWKKLTIRAKIKH